MNIKDCKLDFRNFPQDVLTKVQQICFDNGITWRAGAKIRSRDKLDYLYVKNGALGFGIHCKVGIRRFNNSELPELSPLEFIEMYRYDQQTLGRIQQFGRALRKFSDKEKVKKESKIPLPNGRVAVGPLLTPPSPARDERSLPPWHPHRPQNQVVPTVAELEPSEDNPPYLHFDNADLRKFLKANYLKHGNPRDNRELSELEKKWVAKQEAIPASKTEESPASVISLADYNFPSKL